MKYLEVISEDSDGNVELKYIYIYGSMFTKGRKIKNLGRLPPDRYTLSRRDRWWILSETIWAPAVIYESFYGMFYHNKRRGLVRQKYVTK